MEIYLDLLILYDIYENSYLFPFGGLFLSPCNVSSQLYLGVVLATVVIITGCFSYYQVSHLVLTS